MCVAKLKVLKPFRDKLDHKTSYPNGSILETNDPDRVNDLVKRGLAEVVAIEAKGTGDVGGADPNKAASGSKTGVVIFRDEEFDVQTVKNALIAIGVAVAPNAGANGLTKKIGELTGEQADSLAEKLSTKEE